MVLLDNFIKQKPVISHRVQNACKKKKMSSKNNHSSYKKKWLLKQKEGILMHGTTKETANIVRLLGLFLNFVASRFLAENKRSFFKISDYFNKVHFIIFSHYMYTFNQFMIAIIETNF